jgi:exo-beta-1,3-glucanase (GH17 family)
VNYLKKAKMTYILFLSFSMMLVLFVFNSCNTNKALSMEQVEQNLELGVAIEKEDPFIPRKFNPYLNGEWIGNAISYGCYREGQAPGKIGPSEMEILEDLNILKNYWKLIRVYGSDKDSERVLKVIRDNNLPIKVMLGVWLENEVKHPERKQENIDQVVKAIELGNKYQKEIVAINVGNEARVDWSWHRMEQENIIKYIRMVRNQTKVPVTSADDYNFWNKPEAKEVADELDFLVTHIYALWNGKTLDNAIDWMDTIYFQQLKPIYPDKVIAIGETGWATNYNPHKVGPGEQGSLINGKVGYEAQENYLIQLNKWIKKNQVTTFLFEAFDEPWKGGGAETGPNEVEKHWGVFYENRKPKSSFQRYLHKIEKQ